MKKGLIILAAAAALAIPMATSALAQQQHSNKQHTQKPASTSVKGTVSKVDGNTVTVDNKDVTINDKTVITVDGKPAAADRKIEIGDKVSIKVVEGVAQKVEIRTAKPHKDATDAPKPADQPKTDDQAKPADQPK